MKKVLFLLLSMLFVSASVLADNASPLCFTAKNGSVTVRFVIKNVMHTIKYSTNGNNWSTYTSNKSVHLNPNEKVYFRAALNQTDTIAFGDINAPNCSNFNFSSSDGGTVEASGNIMSLYGPDCPNLELPQYAFSGLFSECNLLTTAPALPATSLASFCYAYMFDYCTSLKKAPALPATTLARYCYWNMFSNCTSLTEAPALPATTLAYGCYYAMFPDCTSLTEAPALPATNLATFCYGLMFSGCTSLTTVPALPATTLATQCYWNMFKDCSSLVVNTSAPGHQWTIPATATATSALKDMFTGTGGTMNGTPSANTTYYIASDPEYNPLCFTAKSAGATVKLKLYSGFNNSYTDAQGTHTLLQYQTETSGSRGAWNDYNSSTVITLPSVGDKVYFRAASQHSQAFCGSITNYSFSQFEIYGSTAASGNIMSLFGPNAPYNYSLPAHAFAYLFVGCEQLTSAPLLPAKTLSAGCYDNMFAGCYGLTTTPDLPATTLADSCYREMFLSCSGLTKTSSLPATIMKKHCYDAMFSSCTSLQNAPALPATTLDDYCYTRMFNSCLALTTAPQLPATTMADMCYWEMFSGCPITTAPALPATNLAHGCYHSMFAGCNHLTSAPQLPATTLARECYTGMFRGTNITTPPLLPATTMTWGCYAEMFMYSALTEAPVLPATTLAENCYEYMFSGCRSLTEAPALNATSLVSYCYKGMFMECTNLTIAPALPATVLADNCYYQMFLGCSSLVNAPVVNATTLANGCYCEMFYDCTSLINAPALPATVMTYGCYSEMFSGCTSLTTAPILPSTTLATGCYDNMFNGCTSLTTAPQLPATTLASNCYGSMFMGCSNLKETPTLPATTLANGCYYNMFNGCTSLKSLPELQADTLANECYRQMFSGCTSLIVNTFTPGKQWKIDATAVGTNALGNMFSGTGGTMNGTPNANTTYYVESDPPMPLCFTARNGSVNVSFDIKNVTHTIQYSIDSSNWSIYTSNTPIILNSGNKVYFRAETNQTTAIAFGANWQTPASQFIFTSTNGGTIEASGNIMSLYGPDCPDLQLPAYAFAKMFYNCDLLTKAPDLTSSHLSDHCYYCMFRHCSLLTSAPTLSSTHLAQHCYDGMFKDCISLTAAPELPASVLAPSCYSNMFNSCTSLVSPPTMSATQLAIKSCEFMFIRCTSLQTPPALPAMTLDTSCYSGMFKCCTALTTAPLLPATDLAYDCYYLMFDSCTTLQTAPVLPATTLVDMCYGKMFHDCKSLANAPALPATILAQQCYEYMFEGCSSLTQTPDLPANTLTMGCYQFMFRNCTSLTNIVDLPATELSPICYRYMFSGCSSLKTIPTLPATTLYAGCYSNMFKDCSALVINTAQPGKDWMITAADTAYNALTNMFIGTGGTMNGKPSINTTYYIFSDPNRPRVVIAQVNDTIMGVVSGNGYYNINDTATIIATSNQHYHFVQWSNNETNDTLSFIVTQDTTLTAMFAIDQYTIAASANDASMGSVTGGGTFNYGETVTLIATANANHHFVSWSNGKKSANITVSVYGDSTLTAYFAVNPTYLLTDSQEICQGGSYSWRGRMLNASGVYYDSLKTIYGSDSVYKLTLMVNPTYLITDAHEICQGGSYSWRGRELSVAGVYYDSLQTGKGCDSVYQMTLTVNPTYLISDAQEICQGGSYSWRGRTLTVAGVYYDSLLTGKGCDSVYQLTLTVNPTYLISDAQEICQGGSFSWRGRSLSAAGVYYDSLLTAKGCDSVYQLTLTVNPTYLITDAHEICQGESYSWRGRYLSVAGVYYDSLLTGKGCDSVYQMTLTVNPTYLITDAQEICQGGSYSWRGRSLSVAGVYYDSLFTGKGCDSVYQMTLTVNPTYLISDAHEICQGGSYSWKGRSLTAAGVYYDSLVTGKGCDSVYQLTLTVNPTYLITDAQEICQGGSYNWRGRDLSVAGVYYDSLLTGKGCDSVYQLTLTVNPTYLISDAQEICQGGSYNWRGRALTMAGVYYDSLQTGKGCDSVYQLTLTVNPTYLITDAQEICQGESYSWRGRALTAAGVYYDSLLTGKGCDSVYQMTLTVNPTYLITDAQEICQGGSYSWRGRALTTAGVYYDSLQTGKGCDSVYQMTLTVNPTYLITDAQEICQGGSYSWRGRALTTAGVYYDSLLTGKGCDSVYQMTLTVNPTYLITGAQEICQGGSYNWRGRDLSVAGVYYDSLLTGNGCDSVYQLTLTVNPTYLLPETQEICQGGSYNWRGRALSVAGVYYDSLQTGKGCDSVYQMTLTVNPTYLLPETQEICQGESYSWRGRTLTTEGVYYDSLLTGKGCDSVYQMTLTVNPTYLMPETQEICQGESYSWRGRTLTTEGVYYDSLLTGKGCDSVYQMTLNVIPTYLIKDTIEICQGDSFSWSGMTLSTPGVYYDTLLTVKGCDSVYQLTLIVNPTYLIKDSQEVCQGESYIWRGMTLSATGVYYDYLQTGKGCDSVLQMNFTVNPTYLYTDTQVICQGRTYSWRGRTLSAGGVYYDSLQTSKGCDSVYKLTLTVNPTYEITFANYDGSVLQRDTLCIGSLPHYDGATPTRAATAQYTYTFKDWSPALSAVSGVAIYTAQYDSVIRSYTVSVNCDSSEGSVTGGGTFEYGQSATLTATANAHYHFVSWSNGQTSPSITVTVYGDTSLTATFAIDQFMVTAVSSDTTMGSVTGGGVYDYGEIVTLNATANEHYNFAAWSNGMVTSTITITVTDDVTLTAVFVAKKYNVVAVANYSNRGTVSGSGEYYYLDKAALTASPVDGYKFTGWSNGETSQAIFVTVEGDTALTAYFEVDSTGSAVDDVRDMFEIAVYPNPVHVGGTTFVEVSEDVRMVEVYDADGKLVDRIEAEGNRVEVTGLEVAGMYIVRVVRMNGEVVTRKVIVE